MKSTLINKEEKAREIKYPCLMTAHANFGEVVVLFHDECCGTVVYSERVLQPIGYYTKAWVMDYFTPFDGTIELSNN